jgi:hypothetical protein
VLSNLRPSRKCFYGEALLFGRGLGLKGPGSLEAGL